VQKYSKITVDWKEFETLKAAGLTSKEIADRMGISLSSLKRAKAAAKCL
jgi:DNA-binding CsgD family transcriptional regulator